ncbi:MAG: flagellar export chaperone FliS [Polyangiaceae bacterium]
MSGAFAAVAKYKQVQVSTSGPGDVLLLLYQGFFRFTTEAKGALGAGNLALAGEKISRAHAILEELCAGLNYEVAPELCANLEALYGFAMRRLVEANVTRDAALLDDATQALLPLYEAWKTAVKG